MKKHTHTGLVLDATYQHACSLTHADKHTHTHTHTHTHIHTHTHGGLMHKHNLLPEAIGYIAMHTKKIRIEEGQGAKREMDETSE